MKTVANLLWEEDGQGLVEYAFILVLVAVGLIGVLGVLGEGVSLFYKNTGNNLSGV